MPGRAPKHCGINGCTTIVPNGQRCAQHQHRWGSSTWKKPPGWDTTRVRILTRDNHTCYLCNQPGATEVDHVHNQAGGGPESDHNLRAVHKNCHKTKTARDRWQPRGHQTDTP